MFHGLVAMIGPVHDHDGAAYLAEAAGVPRTRNNPATGLRCHDCWHGPGAGSRTRAPVSTTRGTWRSLTATAALAWNGDLPRPLQQILFDTADGLTPPAPAALSRAG
jgi:hypothetical protein